MKVGTPPRKSIRRPVTLISARDGEPAIEVTPRQIAIGKMIGAAIGAVPVAILLLTFHSNTGPTVTPQAVAEQPQPGAEDVARVKAEAAADAKGRSGTFFASCTYMPSGTEFYRELSYRDGTVQETSATRCAVR